MAKQICKKCGKGRIMVEGEKTCSVCRYHRRLEIKAISDRLALMALAADQEGDLDQDCNPLSVMLMEFSDEVLREAQDGTN